MKQGMYKLNNQLFHAIDSEEYGIEIFGLDLPPLVLGGVKSAVEILSRDPAAVDVKLVNGDVITRGA